MKRVAILGASGYSGQEARRLLAAHPHIEVTWLGSARQGEPDPPAHPFDPPIEALDLARLATVDGVLLCTPHGISSTLAAAALAAGAVVVDLSADFRLRDPAQYATTYGAPHHHPELIGEAVYGLTEHRRAALGAARLVANPGCYPTSILLPLLPLLQHKLIAADRDIIADSKSGLSGAGKAPTARTHFGAVHDNFLAYGVGDHRHLPEIQQEAGTRRIVFVPHLLPIFRGILSTIYLPPAQGVTVDTVRACLSECYADEPFVRVYPKGQPEIAHVVHSNRCDIGVAQAGDRIVLVSVIDNLVKGAAGQAIQNLNLLLGLPEGSGLPR